MSMKEQDKTKVPQQQRSIQTKSKIVEAAVQLFKEKGYYNTNTKEIAKAAGVATGSFYSYFADKREVFIEAYNEHKERFNTIIETGIRDIMALDPKDKRDMFRQILRLILDAHHIFDFLHPELDILSVTDPEFKKVCQEYVGLGTRITTGFLKQVEGDLRVKDLEAAGTVMFFSLRRIIDLLAHNQAAIEGERILNELADMLTAYLYGHDD